jgi:hypothetical protein
MKWGKNGQYDTLKDFLDSEEGKESISEFVRELAMKDIRKGINMDRMKRFYSTQAEFDVLMERIANKHNDRWDNVCYNQGYEPYPWECLYAIFNIAEKDGSLVDESLDGFTENFPSSIFEYMGWQFAITFGQGSVMSVYKNKELMIRV